MTTRALTLAAIAGAAITIWILYLYRKKKLNEDQAIIWLFISVSIFLISTMPDLLWILQWVFGLGTPSLDVLLAAFIGFLLIISIYYSVRISELTDQNERLVQEMALIKATVLPMHEEKKKTS